MNEHEGPDQVEQATQGELQHQTVLRRSTEDKVIAGVAGGLGRYFGIDPVLIRIAFVVLLFFGGSGFLLYLIGWIAIPEEKPGDLVGEAPRTGGGDTVRYIIGGLLVIGGAIWLLGQLFPRFDEYLGPVILIGLGVAVLFLGSRR